MIIRSKTFEQWMKANFDEVTLGDLFEHGAIVGFPGLTYYSDTCKLYEKFKSEIWELVVDQAEDFGYNNVFEFMTSWQGSKSVSDDTTFENLMVWFAAEEIARRILEF